MSKKRAGGGSNLGNKRAQVPRFRLMLKLRQWWRSIPCSFGEFLNDWNIIKIFAFLDFVSAIMIIRSINYTEIDWSTYMAQVKQIFNGTNFNFNYTQIEGPTGPLVYPAGHVYVFYLLKELTEDGSNIVLAQYIYALIYLAQMVLVYKIYTHKRTAKAPAYVYAMMCVTSHRIHSIYLLRLFNDPIAVLAAYASFFAFLRKKHALSAFLFSFAISIKMNILLFAPAYALIFFEELGLNKSIKYAGIALGTQILLAAPFLVIDPMGYLQRSFNFGRVFLHQWTVNWRFLDERTFTSPQFFRILLYVHIALLLLLFISRWLNAILKLFNPKREFTFHLWDYRREDPILTLFIANFIGVACSRSLHYQFYVWYYHSLPMILWATRFSVPLKLLILGCIEFAWNRYPSTTYSCSLLHASHLLIIIGLFTSHYKSKWWSFGTSSHVPKKSKSGKK